MGIDPSPPQLTSTQVLKVYPSYKYQKIPPNQGTTDVSLNLTTYVWHDYELPASVFNLPESYIEFWLNTTDANTGDNTYPWFRADCISIINAIRFKIIDGSAPLIDIPYFPQYQKLFLPRELTVAEFQCRDITTKCFPLNVNTGWSTTAAIRKPNGQNYGLSVPSTAAKINTTGQTTVPYIVNSPNDIIQAYRSGISAASNGLNDTVDFVRFKLSDLKQTICNYVPDIYFGQRALFSLQLGPTTFYSWTSGSATDPSASTVSQPPTQTVKVVSPYMYLAVENNLAVAQDVRTTILAKRQINAPYIHCIKQQTASGTSASATFSVSKNYGTHLNMVTTSFFNTAETLNTALDNSNILKPSLAATASSGYAASKVKSYRTNLGPEPLQYYDADCNTTLTGLSTNTNLVAGDSPGVNDDWTFNRPLLKDSICNGLQAYRENWHHTDFFGSTNLKDPWHSNEVTGRALSPDPINWSIIAQVVSSAYMIYIFMVFNRVLTVSEDSPVMFQ
jgi:uncharacterized protein Usg